MVIKPRKYKGEEGCPSIQFPPPPPLYHGRGMNLRVRLLTDPLTVTEKKYK